nr:unnamed protein product [Callosobruchus chinensis]
MIFRREHDQNSDKLEAVVESECPKLTYRTFNGYCNNLKNPDRGTTNSYYARLLPPGEYRNRTALPTPASVSEKLYIDKPVTEKGYTLASMQYGQFVAHDISSRVFPVGAQKQITTATSYLDLSVIYGNDKKAADSIRLFKGGLLKTEMKHGQEFPKSLKHPTVEDNCSDMRDPGESCYDIGDNRSNQNPQLAVIHILFMREHNRIARQLSKLNPEWCDEKVFQEARKINIAQHQHIAFYQYLPIVLGRKNMIHNKIIQDAEGYVDDYDEDIDATAFDEHGTAAFRYYHTQIAGHLNTRVGDRYWYEHSGQLGFTLPQLKEIRKSSLAKLMCDNAKITKMQRDSFYIPDAEK